MIEYLFLIILAGIYLVVASISDLKKREVANWLNFSLVIFALAYRFFYSVLSDNWNFFVMGLFGFAVFFILSYVFYYGRIFAGGDAKLMMGLGAIIPFSSAFLDNIFLFFIFIFFVMASGSIWGLCYSFFLAVRCKNFGKEFRKQFWKNKKINFLCLIITIILFFLLSFLENFFGFEIYILPLLFLVFPFLYSYAKSLEDACMIAEIPSRNATIGDWLYEKVKIGKKIIQPNWEGLSEKEVELLKKSNKKIKIKQGIPFVPAFLFGFILFLILKEKILFLIGF